MGDEGLPVPGLPVDDDGTASSAGIEDWVASQKTLLFSKMKRKRVRSLDGAVDHEIIYCLGFQCGELP
jgi:hypothetical protein